MAKLQSMQSRPRDAIGGVGSSELQLSFDSEHRLRAENLCFDIDTWYSKIEQFTFKSTFIPLRKVEASAILAYNDLSWRHKRSALTEIEVALLRDLEASIDVEVRSLLDSHKRNKTIDSSSNNSGGGGCDNENDIAVFLRLCGRSPKVLFCIELHCIALHFILFIYKQIEI